MICTRVRTVLLSLVFMPVLAMSLSAADAVFGRWALTLPNGGAGWLEVVERDGWYDGSILWGGGSVLPLANVVVEDGTLTVTRVRALERKDAAGEVVRTQQLTETITGTASGDTLTLTRTAPRSDGRGFDRESFSGQRIPPLPPRPNLAQVKFGPAIALLNGRDLSGWSLLGTGIENGWRVEEDVLINEPAPHVPGQQRRRFGNLRTNQEFTDFRLTLDVNVPEGSNSGVYLRGIYEVQVADSHGKPVDSHNMGAIYSRITPTVAAEKPAGEWQHLDITLVDRHVTVVLNGQTIIDNQPLAGCTGGALWSDQSRPGPIYLQGDHGPVSYRNLTLYPVVR